MWDRERTKKINIAIENENQSMLKLELWDDMIMTKAILFKEFANVFAYNYNDLNSIPKEYDVLRIELQPHARPIRQFV